MVATLDYAGYPHLFANIIGHCELRTQNQLRLLSSSAKLDVDRYHCRFIQICLEVRDPELQRLRVGALLFPATLNSCFPIKVPILSSPDGPPSEGSNVLWALKNTRHVTVWDVTLESRNLNILLTHLSEECTDLTLYYHQKRLLPEDTLKRRLVIPASVQHLHLYLTTVITREPLKFCVFVYHRCSTVTIVLEELSHFQDAPVFLGMMGECIEHLILVVVGLSEAASFLESLEPYRLNSQLKVTILLTSGLVNEGMNDFSKEWSERLKAQVEVQLYVLGDDSFFPKLREFEPTTPFRSETMLERYMQDGWGFFIGGKGSIGPCFNLDARLW